MERNASSAVKRGEVGSLRRTVFGLMLVCFCMRSPMSTVGPLVAQMKETLHLSSSFSGMLTTIPLFIFGLTALVSGRFLHKLQVRTWFLLDTALILAGILGRSYLGVPGLLAGTACLGLGIGILNVLTPVWIRQDWAAHLGPVMGAYSASMNAMSGVAAGTAVILSALLGGWQNAMALFALFPAAAILFWAPSREARHPLAVKTAEPLSSTARRLTSWCVALFMGLQSCMFFSITAWLSSIFQERGFSESAAGAMVFVFQTFQILTNYFMPIFYQRYPRQRRALAASCGILYGTGPALLLLTDIHSVLMAGTVLMGLGAGLTFSLAITLIAVKGRNEAEAVRLSSFAQFIGYFLAAPAPFLIGAIQDRTGTFTIPILLMLVWCALLVILGLAAVWDERASGSEHTSGA